MQELSWHSLNPKDHWDRQESNTDWSSRQLFEGKGSRTGWRYQWQSRHSENPVYLESSTQLVYLWRHDAEMCWNCLPQAWVLCDAEMHRWGSSSAEATTDFEDSWSHSSLCQKSLWQLRGVVCAWTQNGRGQSKNRREATWISAIAWHGKVLFKCHRKMLGA